MQNLVAMATVLITTMTAPVEVDIGKLSMGEHRITEYCRYCNTPVDTTVTASGRWEPGYSVASSDYPLGLTIVVGGEEYRVDDTGCPKGTIDILIESEEECKCNRLDYLEIYRKI